MSKRSSRAAQSPRQSVPVEPTPAEQRYRKLIQKLARSGSGIRTFARSHAVKPETLTWWRYEIARRDRVRAEKPREEEPVFLPVRVVDPVPCSQRLEVEEPARPYEILLRSGRLIKAPRGFDSIELRSLVQLLEEVPC